MLAKHRQYCDQRAVACGLTLQPSSYAFSRDVDGKRPGVPNEVTKEFIRLRRVVDLESVRLHDLRYFAATRLLAEGVPVRNVSGRLGHANASTMKSNEAKHLEKLPAEAELDKAMFTGFAEGSPLLARGNGCACG